MFVLLIRTVLYMLQLLLLGLFAYMWIPVLIRLSLSRKFATMVSADGELPSVKSTNFVVLIPAHNEERAIGGLLESLNEQTYPLERLFVHVVSDNSTDATAAVVDDYGYTCYLRATDRPSSKGQALAWLWMQLPSNVRSDDDIVIVILDADCTVVSDYFVQLDRAFAAGATVVQSNRRVARHGGSRVTEIEAASEEIRQQMLCGVRRLLGMSAYLCGSGIAFRGRIFQRLIEQQETGTSITEDVSWQIWLIKQGLTVMWWPQAILTYEAVRSMSQFRRQRNRWVGDHIRGIFRQGLPLLWRGIRTANATCIDQGLKLSQLPRSVVVMLSLGLSLIAALWPEGSLAPWWAWLGLAASLGVYLLIGFARLKVPLRVYASLLVVPFIVVQVTAISVFAMIGRTARHWEAIDHGAPSDRR